MQSITLAEAVELYIAAEEMPEGSARDKLWQQLVARIAVAPIQSLDDCAAALNYLTRVVDAAGPDEMAMLDKINGFLKQSRAA